eukprot:gene47642-biopygen33159
MSEIFYVVPEEQHNLLIAAAYKKRGYSTAEAEAGARFCADATRHGIRTHNGLKALHLDHLFGPGASYKIVRYDAQRQPELIDTLRIAAHPRFNMQGIASHRASADVALLLLPAPLPGHTPAPIGGGRVAACG